MKKLILLVITAFCFINLNAQCTPQTGLTTPGLYPNPIATGTVGSPMSQVMTTVFPDKRESNITIPITNLTVAITAYFTSFEVKTVTGVPTGTSMPLSSCNVNNCIFPIVQNQVNTGCMTLSGTPSTTGSFVITTTNKANGYIILPQNIPTIGNAGDTISFDDSRFSPVQSQISGIRNINYSSNLNVFPVSLDKSVNQAWDFSVYPNPAQNEFKISFLPLNSDKATLNIKDLTGRIVFSQNIEFTAQIKKEIAVNHEFPSSMYFVEVVSENANMIQKIIVE